MLRVGYTVAFDQMLMVRPHCPGTGVALGTPSQDDSPFPVAYFLHLQVLLNRN